MRQWVECPNTGCGSDVAADVYECGLCGARSCDGCLGCNEESRSQQTAGPRRCRSCGCRGTFEIAGWIEGRIIA